MRLIEVVVQQGHLDTILSIAEQYETQDVWAGAIGEDGRQSIRMLVNSEQTQTIIDALQKILGGSEQSRILVLPIEASLPRSVDDASEENKLKRKTAAARDEMYHDIEKNAKLDSTYLILVILSTVVATIGMLKDNVAVIIGAMVIAPLLGPNLALALGTSLGDRHLISRSLRTALVGIVLAAFIAAIIGSMWAVQEPSVELLARTQVGLDTVALALASGAAAVLSVTTGLSSVLVGVMVAVAILPPSAAVGLMIGMGDMPAAIAALVLLAVNIVCINLSAQLVFLFKGVKPRTWLEQQQASQSRAVYFLVWVVSLGFLVYVIYVL